MHQKGALRKNTGETAELRCLTRDAIEVMIEPTLLVRKKRISDLPLDQPISVLTLCGRTLLGL